ncbi:hypothetical protein Tco_0618206 [Tanacetum coccineum]
MFVQLQGDRKEPLDKEYVLGAYVGMLRTKSTTRYNGVRECELSHVGVLGEGLSKEGLGFMVVKRSDEDDKGDNQRIDWVNNHITIREKRDGQ